VSASKKYFFHQNFENLIHLELLALVMNHLIEFNLLDAVIVLGYLN